MVDLGLESGILGLSPQGDKSTPKLVSISLQEDERKTDPGNKVDLFPAWFQVCHMKAPGAVI